MIHEYLRDVAHNPLIIMTAAAVALDTILGLLRAAREKRFNSNFGIDGAIRKSGMMVSVLFLMFADSLIKINLIGFLSEEVRESLSVTKVGLGEFFCLLYIVYEAVSILKNMALCGIPIPKPIKTRLERFLTEMTSEVKEGRQDGGIDNGTEG